MTLISGKTIQIGSRLVRKFTNGNIAVLEKSNGKRMLRMFDENGKSLRNPRVAYVNKETVGNKKVLTKVHASTAYTEITSRVYNANDEFLGSRISHFNYQGDLSQKKILLPDGQESITTMAGINNKGEILRASRDKNGFVIKYNDRGLPVPKADIGEGKWKMSLREMRAQQQWKFPFERYLPEECGLTALDETVPGRFDFPF